MSKLRLIIGIVLILPFFVLCGVRMYRSIIFHQQCEGYLDQAAHANQIPDAILALNQALEYARFNGYTSGYTSIFYRTPDEDIGFWFRNLEAASAELNQMSGKPVTPLEQSNVLMKLHETLKRPVPTGITVYPHNTLWFWSMWLSFAAAIVGAVLTIYQINLSFPKLLSV